MITRPSPRAWFAVAIVALAMTLGRVASAAPEDGPIRDAVQQIMSEDYPGSLAPAKRKLQDQLSLCMRKGCSGNVKGEIYVALGMVASQLGLADEAKQDFKNAVGADPNAKLPANTTPAIRANWDDATGKTNAAASPDEAESGVSGTIKLIQEALAADRAGRLEECIEKDRAALKLDDSPRTRLHLASCESRNGKLVDALKDARRALQLGVQKRDSGVMKVAGGRVQELLERIPHVTFAPPPGVPDLVVRFDDRLVPPESLTKKFSVDPGKHTVVAEGTVNGFQSVFEQEYDVKERELVTVQITLKPPTSDFITPGQIKCMLAAKSQEEVQKCLPQSRKSLVVRAGFDMSGYSDTNAVAVATPGINFSLVSPTAGWNAGGNFVIDAVSAASPDIVASASPPFKEYRYAGGLTGGYKPGLYGGQVSGSFSSSPDYVSFTGGFRLMADLNDKLITPLVGYSYSLDRIGRGPNNYLDNFNDLKGRLDTHEFELGSTFIMSPTAILVLGGTFSMQRGDQSQPYRYVALFDQFDVAPFLPKGGTVDLANRYRLPVKALEQLPTARDRYAFGVRFNKRIGNTTLRLDQRLYHDTWDINASTTDARYMMDLSRHLRVWPHFRFHGQTGANFYNMAYGATIDNFGNINLPTYRTGDRELSPLLTFTAGGGARIALGELEGDIKYGLTFVGDLMYTRYLNALYVRARTAIYGALAFDVEF